MIEAPLQEEPGAQAHHRAPNRAPHYVGNPRVDRPPEPATLPIAEVRIASRLTRRTITTITLAATTIPIRSRDPRQTDETSSPCERRHATWNA